MQETIVAANRLDVPATTGEAAYVLTPAPLMGPADLATRPERWRKALRDGSLIAFILLVGLSGSVLTYRAIETNNTLQRLDRINAVSQSVFEAFDLETTRAVEAVRSAALMVASQQHLTRREFENYGVGVMARSPKLTSLQWLPVVDRKSVV